MKRYMAAVLAAVIALSASAAVLAESTGGYASGGKVYVSSEDNGAAVLSFYDGDGALIYSVIGSREDEEYVFDVPDEVRDDRARICFTGGDIYDLEITDEETESEETPAPTDEPTEAPTAEPTATALPEAYERPVDAIGAPAVVISSVQTQKDGEDFTELTLLYQGNTVKVDVNDTVAIESAPKAAEDIVGSGADALREGDVIKMTAYVSGTVRRLDLLYRPDFDNYIVNGTDCGTDFRDIFSAGGGSVMSYSAGPSDSGTQYAFGVPIEVRGSVLTMADADGRIADITVNNKAFVYTVDSVSDPELTGYGCGAVERSYVPRTGLAEDGSVANWEDADITSYALVRIVEGAATEIVVFTL